MSIFFVTFGGLFAGVVWNQLFTRFLRLLFTCLGKSIGEPQKFVPAPHPWAIPLLVLHPACWLLLGALYLAYLAAVGRVDALWGWFLGGFSLGVASMWATALLILHKSRVRRSQGTGA